MELREVDDWLARLFPPACALCGSPGQRRELCRPCTADLPWIVRGCTRCGRPLPAGVSSGRCQACPWPASQLDRVIAAVIYEYPVDGLITAFKYGHRLELGRALGEILAAKLLALPAAERGTPPDCLLPVPLHRQRYAERGFNQAGEIARVLCRRLGLPLAGELLTRQRDTPVQAALGAMERRRNLRDAFKASPACSGLHIAIIDDVITTGSTALAIASELRAAGASSVECWTAALTY